MSFQAVWPRHCTQLGSFSPIFYDGAIIPVSDKVIWRSLLVICNTANMINSKLKCTKISQGPCLVFFAERAQIRKGSLFTIPLMGPNAVPGKQASCVKLSRAWWHAWSPGAPWFARLGLCHLYIAICPREAVTGTSIGFELFASIPLPGYFTRKFSSMRIWDSAAIIGVSSSKISKNKVDGNPWKTTKRLSLPISEMN